MRRFGTDRAILRYMQSLGSGDYSMHILPPQPAVATRKPEVLETLDCGLLVV